MAEPARPGNYRAVVRVPQTHNEPLHRGHALAARACLPGPTSSRIAPDGARLHRDPVGHRASTGRTPEACWCLESARTLGLDAVLPRGVRERRGTKVTGTQPWRTRGAGKPTRPDLSPVEAR